MGDMDEMRLDEHKRLIQKLDNEALNESCCGICHCDCYSSHRDPLLSSAYYDYEDPYLDADYDANNNHYSKSDKQQRSNKEKKRSRSRTTNRSPCNTVKRSLTLPHAKRRSKSANSLHSQSQRTVTNFTRDCDILQHVLIAGKDDPTLPHLHVAKAKLHSDQQARSSPSLADSTPLKLCASLSTLCLQPDVRQAFQQVPAHDQRILNRMAAKRSEQLLAKENAWLARRYWENERYERELLKCEQIEEYKQAVRDKQFQDYVLTKTRLHELAQRDLDQLQRLRATLQQKDVRTRQRLESLQLERTCKLQQRRCDDLRKSEAVSLQQEEQQLDELLRKQQSCQRVTQRLKRADQLRTQMLEAYLRRLRNDNQLEQLLHEEHWRETHELQLAKREELKAQICRKRWRTQQFTEDRQRRNAALAKTAKISASLRELVRTSVTPDSLPAIK